MARWAVWYVRKSADSGHTWAMADRYYWLPYATIGCSPNVVYCNYLSTFEDARAIGFDSTGSIYVAGTASADLTHAFIRKSEDHGRTWRVIANFTAK